MDTKTVLSVLERYQDRCSKEKLTYFLRLFKTFSQKLVKLFEPDNFDIQSIYDGRYSSIRLSKCKIND